MPNLQTRGKHVAADTVTRCLNCPLSTLSSVFFATNLILQSVLHLQRNEDAPDDMYARWAFTKAFESFAEQLCFL